MLKNQYFIEAIQAQKYKELGWLLTILAVTVRPKLEDVTVETGSIYQLVDGPKNKLYFLDPVSKEFQPIDDSESDKPLFYRKEIVKIPGGTINIPLEIHELTTTVGNVILNAITLFHPLGKKIPFMNGGKTITDIDKIDPGKVEKAVSSLVVDDKTYEKNPDKFISVKELREWIDAVTWCGELASISNPSISEKSVRVDPSVLKRRDELYEQYKDDLGNPAIQAKIEQELVKMDKESLKDDPSFDFYYKSKHWENSRKKKLMTIGLLGSIYGEPKFIKEPLIAGVDAELIPDYSNAIRHASYSRGHLTALGGELVKYIFRVTQNIKITEVDCKTKFGLPDMIQSGYERLYYGRYFMTANGYTEITADNIKGLIGKTILLRSPAYCKTLNGNFCEICMGKDLSKTPNAIHTAATNPGSVMMNASMKAMHGKALKTTRLSFKAALT